MGARIITYDIHTPSSSDPDEERDIEKRKRDQMKVFLTLNEAVFVGKSTYTFNSDQTAKEIFDQVWNTVFNPEREKDDLFIGELCNETAVAATKRYWDNVEKLRKAMEKK